MDWGSQMNEGNMAPKFEPKYINNLYFSMTVTRLASFSNPRCRVFRGDLPLPACTHPCEDLPTLTIVCRRGDFPTLAAVC